MHQQTTVTGRIASQPPLQNLPLPLTDVQRRDVERIKAALWSAKYADQPAFFRWMQRQSTMATQGVPIGTLVDSLDHWALWKRWPSMGTPSFAQAEARVRDYCERDLRQHLALFGIELPHSKSALSQALESVFGPFREPKPAVTLH